MTTIERWSGVEVRALREAMRMSLREFAAHLGVSERMISKWEAGRENIRPRPVNQAALDTCLTRSDADTRARFSRLIGTDALLTAGEAEAVKPIGSDHVRHSVDGSLMALVEGSVFQAGPGNTPLWLPSYYIDVYPVSNQEYAQFVAATGAHTPRHWTGGTFPADLAEHPVVFVTWPDAVAYAEWVGKALPTSQQWEKAARGTRGSIYPWGDQATPAKCNVRENGIGNTTPRDCYMSGGSTYGVHDLCGNVWEWCSTETSPGRYELKGGAWTSPFVRATPSSFNDAAASMCDDDTGFRCAVPA
ncbi:SUMF1/EgtB/PvdO family nonheme iron enzyme [Pseudonocardia dioxanivorans]|uniref:SUMF1/EgtB/PvdO family nonheme iron enzyme n=1 Tax=Pseudonocardia dioxanivorans TaxID=240495 RepID=UPI000CD21D88|nr:SUMF1/EgtB/PvdO family nonheme iron enzyme [Pseudonocardia dioxanivorans]